MQPCSSKKPSAGSSKQGPWTGDFFAGVWGSTNADEGKSATVDEQCDCERYHIMPINNTLPAKRNEIKITKGVYAAFSASECS
jgi:hypothetical protein